MKKPKGTRRVRGGQHGNLIAGHDARLGSGYFLAHSPPEQDHDAAWRKSQFAHSPTVERGSGRDGEVEKQGALECRVLLTSDEVTVEQGLVHGAVAKELSDTISGKTGDQQGKTSE